MDRTEKAQLKVTQTIDLPTLPSGSGMAISGDIIFIAGDDSPFLFQLNMAYEVVEKQLILPHFTDAVRIPKPGKPDLESMLVAHWQGKPSLLIFGSGSKSPERDSLIVVSLEQPQEVQTYSLTGLYDAICALEGIGRDDLNLEGAVSTGDTLWLLNRGRNTVITLSLASLSSFVSGTLPLDQLNLQTQPMQLPQIAGKQARFSGACSIPGSNLVLFTATVEDTENWIDDGEILGSFVGVLDPQQLKQGTISSAYLLTDEQGNALPEKLESIDVLAHSGNSLKLLTIADNDDGSSRLLELTLKPFTYQK